MYALWWAIVACTGPVASPSPVDTATPSWTGSGIQVCEADAPSWTSRRLDLAPPEEHRFEGGGVAVLDVDGDDHLDLLFPGPRPRLYLGPDFVDELPLPDPGALVTGVSAADADADGDPDVFLSRFGAPDVLWRNDAGALTAVDVGIDGGPGHSQSSAWADLDGDGWLDLAVAGHGAVGVEGDQVVIDHPADPTRLWGGGPDLTFVDRTDRLPDEFHDAYTFLVAPTRLDDDHEPDLYAANDHPAFIPQRAAYNRGDRFDLDDGTTGLAPYGAGMGLGIGDLDGDGVDELLLPVWDRVLLLQSFAGGWVEAAAASGLRLPAHSGAWVGWGAELADLDLDGHLDAIVAFGHLDALAARTVGGAPARNEAQQPILTWLGGEGGFIRATLGFPTGGVHRGLVLADLNGDGVLDLAAPDLDGGADLLISTCSPRAWLEVALEQPGGNRDAIGAELWVELEGRRLSRTIRAGGTGLMSSGPPVAHFGLGDAEVVDLHVRWPDGRVDSARVDTRQRIRWVRP